MGHEVNDTGYNVLLVQSVSLVNQALRYPIVC